MDFLYYLFNLILQFILNIPDANFLKDRIKFKKGKYVYGEISFSNSRTFEGVILHLYAYNSEMGNFFSQNVPPYDKSSNPYDLVFVQPSISQAHFFKAPPITSFPYRDTIKLPESENDTKKIYPDVLKHLQKNQLLIDFQQKSLACIQPLLVL